MTATITHVAEALEALARDLQRPRPSDQTPEESDRRIAARLAARAAQLREALR